MGCIVDVPIDIGHAMVSCSLDFDESYLSVMVCIYYKKNLFMKIENYTYLWK